MMVQIRAVYIWSGADPSLLKAGNRSVLVMTDVALFFTADSLAEHWQEIELLETGETIHIDQLENLFPYGLKAIEYAHVKRVTYVEHAIRFCIFHSEGKLVIPFGDGGKEAAVKHFKQCVQHLPGFVLSDVSQVSHLRNLANPLFVIGYTVICAWTMLHLLSLDEYHPISLKAYLIKWLHSLVHMMGKEVVWALILAGLWFSLRYLIKRIKQPLKEYVAKLG